MCTAGIRVREVTPKPCTERGDTLKSRFPLTSFCIIALVTCCLGQTYDVNGQGGSTAPQTQKSSDNSAQTNTELGWGSSIDVARQARAADEALKRNDYPAAISYAERAPKSAPQNPELWFLLGYCDRLGDHYQASVDAYNRGLKIQPNSVRGMA